jgi:phospholipid/cholesterol/gamma-HCH transport system ATP-binding protein
MTIEFQKVSKAFSHRKILEQISFLVPAGQILFILGRSGMGKSVSLKLMVGLLKADSGKVLIEGHDITHATEDELMPIRRKCGMVFQHPALFDSMTVFENIAFGLSERSAAQKLERVQECLHLVHLSDDILDKRPGQISYGMQKRVSLARTLAPGPKYILFDEPTTGLDPITTSAINDLIHELSRKLNITSIVVSHDMGCALKIADKIMAIDQSKIEAYGTVEDMRTHPSQLIKDFMQEAW